ncbi:TPM domain-containing protein [Microbacterium excoecariae]|uniref:TPM domain-containing protein n=1 Tax=Microbacterium excoecariae TaxID=2715210 RepID=UPI00140D7380|nr:TPM domain-containing protein [Microbacterium excoecariae]NHI16367.1 TPM domain-containing protein [Microbacterium excoecariae]
MRRLVIGLAALLGALALVSGAAVSATATPPVALGAGYVVDDAGVLSADELSSAEARLDELAAGGEAELWVVFVDTFTDPSDAGAWADQTAEAGGLGSGQYLLAIATEGRQLYLSAPADGALSEAELVAIETAAAGPAGDGEWAQAAAAAADALADRTTPNPLWGWAIGAIVVAAALAVAGLVLFSRGRAARRRKAAQEESAAELARLETRAAELLVEMDDAVRTAGQELGFAIAQFGQEATAEYATALREARDDLAAAFEIRQHLDRPEATPGTRADELERIIALVTAADESLDAHAAGFERLRGIERRAPEVLRTIAAELDEAGALPGRIAAEVERLTAAYDSPALADVADDAEEARARLAFARAALAEAQRHLDAGEAAEAALDIQDAEQALGQAREMADTVRALADRLAEAERRAAEEARQDRAEFARISEQAAVRIQSADGYLAARRGAVSAEPRQAIAEARRALDAAHGQLVAGETDAALAQARRALSLADHASAAAHRDVAGFRAGGPGPSGGDQLLAGILGGIIGSSLSGSSRRGSGWASSSRSASRSRSRSRSRSPRGFGGGGRRGRSGGGRRF